MIILTGNYLWQVCLVLGFNLEVPRSNNRLTNNTSGFAASGSCYKECTAISIYQYQTETYIKMSTFILGKGESEEHSHEKVSTTTLLEGTAELVIGGSRKPLELGKTVTIPANVSHAVINIGKIPAKYTCVC
jgi:mannose-6-phosphate isomerase-like protein (cupin superfamily)